MIYHNLGKSFWVFQREIERLREGEKKKKERESTISINKIVKQ